MANDVLVQNNLSLLLKNLLAVRIHRMHTYHSRPLVPRAANHFELKTSLAQNIRVKKY